MDTEPNTECEHDYLPETHFPGWVPECKKCGKPKPSGLGKIAQRQSDWAEEKYRQIADSLELWTDCDESDEDGTCRSWGWDISDWCKGCCIADLLDWLRAKAEGEA